MKRLTEDGRLRRYCADQQTKAERTIQLAVDAVETIGAAPELTEVVMMLGNAREKLADYLEGVDGEICEHNKEPDHE